VTKSKEGNMKWEGVFEFSGGEVVARPVTWRPNPAATGAGVAGSGGGR
jgi:hypothetical protein